MELLRKKLILIISGCLLATSFFIPASNPSFARIVEHNLISRAKIECSNIFLKIWNWKYCIRDHHDPNKVTDPRQPGFDVTKFRWDDYRGATDLVQVFRVIFPIGTSREYVEKILLQQPEARKISEESFADYRKLIDRPNAGPAYRELFKNNRFLQSKIMVRYSAPVKQAMLGPGSGWTTDIFFNEKNQVTQILVQARIVHKENSGE